ncbi:hypothetical protein K502DRAFT_353434 [Neoconidiobolus thromboides FSU 785]|nr:hypothetical protein K502DRAFT_353434 [Neoconidiobolus thromboides FSU 785]
MKFSFLFYFLLFLFLTLYLSESTQTHIKSSIFQDFVDGIDSAISDVDQFFSTAFHPKPKSTNPASIITSKPKETQHSDSKATSSSQSIKSSKLTSSTIKTLTKTLTKTSLKAKTSSSSSSTETETETESSNSSGTASLTIKTMSRQVFDNYSSSRLIKAHLSCFMMAVPFFYSNFELEFTFIFLKIDINPTIFIEIIRGEVKVLRMGGSTKV